MNLARVDVLLRMSVQDGSSAVVVSERELTVDFGFVVSELRQPSEERVVKFVNDSNAPITLQVGSLL